MLGQDLQQQWTHLRPFLHKNPKDREVLQRLICKYLTVKVLALSGAFLWLLISVFDVQSTDKDKGGSQRIVRCI